MLILFYARYLATLTGSTSEAAEKEAAPDEDNQAEAAKEGENSDHE